MSKWVLALRLTGVGFYVGGSIMLGVLGGLWLDDRFNTAPILVIVGLLLGLVVAIYGVWRMLLPFIGKNEDKESD